MSCTRLYVEYTETLTVQGSKKRASQPPKGVIWEHMREEFVIFHQQHKGDQAIIDDNFMDLRDNYHPF